MDNSVYWSVLVVISLMLHGLRRWVAGRVTVLVLALVAVFLAAGLRPAAAGLPCSSAHDQSGLNSDATVAAFFRGEMVQLFLQGGQPNYGQIYLTDFYCLLPNKYVRSGNLTFTYGGSLTGEISNNAYVVSSSTFMDFSYYFADVVDPSVTTSRSLSAIPFSNVSYLPVGDCATSSPRLVILTFPSRGVLTSAGSSIRPCTSDLVNSGITDSFRAVKVSITGGYSVLWSPEAPPYFFKNSGNNIHPLSELVYPATFAVDFHFVSAPACKIDCTNVDPVGLPVCVAQSQPAGCSGVGDQLRPVVAVSDLPAIWRADGSYTSAEALRYVRGCVGVTAAECRSALGLYRNFGYAISDRFAGWKIYDQRNYK